VLYLSGYSENDMYQSAIQGVVDPIWKTALSRSRIRAWCGRFRELIGTSRRLSSERRDGWWRLRRKESRGEGGVSPVERGIFTSSRVGSPGLGHFGRRPLVCAVDSTFRRTAYKKRSWFGTTTGACSIVQRREPSRICVQKLHALERDVTATEPEVLRLPRTCRRSALIAVRLAYARGPNLAVR
jgi:hypothetical protein